MASIIKYGKDKIKTVTCKKCDCDIEYTNSDKFEDTQKIVDLDWKFKAIKCPNCGEKIKVG